MKPPAHAPAWAEPLGLRLVEAGFAENGEAFGPLVRTYHDADVWNEVKELQRARAKRLFPYQEATLTRLTTSIEPNMSPGMILATSPS
jgi:hypothetical protein